MQTLSRRGRVSDGGQMTFPFLKVTKFPNDVLFFHRISLHVIYSIFPPAHAKEEGIRYANVFVSPTLLQ